MWYLTVEIGAIIQRSNNYTVGDNSLLHDASYWASHEMHNAYIGLYRHTTYRDDAMPGV